MPEELQARFKLTYDDSPVGRLALLTLDNDREPTRPNVLAEATLGSLRERLDELDDQADCKGLLVTGKPFGFAAGADTDVFEGMDAEQARGSAAAGHEQFHRLAELELPTVAAINGVCMGGALELALHCDYRTVSAAARPIAFPEVFLSILPGWGGTQLTPRLIGGPAALQVVVRNALNDNETLAAREALELGLADRLFDSASFLEDSRSLLEGLVAGEVAIERDVDPAEGFDEALQTTREFVDGKVHGATPAPYRAMELIEFATRGGDLAEGRQREIDALADLLPGRHAQAAIYATNLTRRRVRRQPWRPDTPPRRVDRLGVLGAGTMGAQIAALLVHQHQVPVVVKDPDQGVLSAAREHVEARLAGEVERGRLTGGRARFLSSLVTYTDDDRDLTGADFVIEAVPEELGLKQRLLADLEEVVDPGCVLATNTSSLSVGAMAAGLAHPERMIGFHFFNPVRRMPLVEIVRPEATSGEALATAFEVAETIRKSAVPCADTPGFIVNRLLMRFATAAMAALRSGNSIRGIDAAILQLGLPMGPFQLLQLVVAEIAYHTVRSLAEAFPERYPADGNLRAIAQADAEGIYDPETGRPHAAVTEAIEVDADAEPLAAEAIRDRAVRAAVDEAAIMLEEGVVADARDLDTALLLGAGFPFFMGGICKYADQTGLSEELFGEPLVTPEEDHT